MSHADPILSDVLAARNRYSENYGHHLRAVNSMLDFSRLVTLTSQEHDLINESVNELLKSDFLYNVPSLVTALLGPVRPTRVLRLSHLLKAAARQGVHLGMSNMTAATLEKVQAAFPETAAGKTAAVALQHRTNLLRCAEVVTHA